MSGTSPGSLSCCDRSFAYNHSIPSKGNPPALSRNRFFALQGYRIPGFVTKYSPPLDVPATKFLSRGFSSAMGFSVAGRPVAPLTQLVTPNVPEAKGPREFQQTACLTVFLAVVETYQWRPSFPFDSWLLVQTFPSRHPNFLALPATLRLCLFIGFPPMARRYEFILFCSGKSL